jgi:anti-anti-sigma factor
VVLTSDTRNGIAVITLAGKLVFDESLFTVRPKVRQFLESGVKAIVFDLSGVPYADSSGCGEMIGAYTTIRKADARVVFVGLTPRIRQLWERINLLEIFDIFETLPEAEAFLSTGHSRQE